MDEFNAVDLFSGCGGMSLGFQNAGINILAAFDNWLPAVEVYEKNFPHPIHQTDLGCAQAHELMKKYKPNLIMGGPPCQDFSSAGYGNHSNLRANLTMSFSNIIASLKPAYFVFENVPRARYSKVFSKAESTLRKAGYGITKQIIDASYCSVPQTRKRIFMIGHLGSDDDFLVEDLKSNLTSNPLTLRDYFGDELGIDYYFRIPTNYNRKAIFSVDEPCVTIRGVDRPIPKTYKKHPGDPVRVEDNVRILTVEERGYVQTFPRDFMFEGTKTNLNQMIGNAVPVKLAEHVAYALIAYNKRLHNRSEKEMVSV